MAFRNAPSPPTNFTISRPTSCSVNSLNHLIARAHFSFTMRYVSLPSKMHARLNPSGAWGLSWLGFGCLLANGMIDFVMIESGTGPDFIGQSNGFTESL